MFARWGSGEGKELCYMAYAFGYELPLSFFDNGQSSAKVDWMRERHETEATSQSMIKTTVSIPCCGS